MHQTSVMQNNVTNLGRDADVQDTVNASIIVLFTQIPCLVSEHKMLSFKGGSSQAVRTCPIEYQRKRVSNW